MLNYWSSHNSEYFWIEQFRYHSLTQFFETAYNFHPRNETLTTTSLKTSTRLPPFLPDDAIICPKLSPSCLRSSTHSAFRKHPVYPCRSRFHPRFQWIPGGKLGWPDSRGWIETCRGVAGPRD